MLAAANWWILLLLFTLSYCDDILEGSGVRLLSRYSLMGENVILHMRTNWRQVLNILLACGS